MEKIKKMPKDWRVINEDEIFKLVDNEGKTKSSIVYRVDKDAYGRTFLKLISVTSGREQGKGYYSILYSGLESFAKSSEIEYFSGFITPENTRSRIVHNHLGFSEVEQVSYLNGIEKRIRVEKDISI